MKPRELAAWLLALTLLFVVGIKQTVAATVCGDFNGDHPIAWLVCNWESTNDRVDALGERLAVLEQRTLTAEQAGAVAWQKAEDRLHLWKQESSAYQDRYLFDTIYSRMKVHICRMGVPHNETVRCP